MDASLRRIRTSLGEMFPQRKMKHERVRVGAGGWYRRKRRVKMVKLSSSCGTTGNMNRAYCWKCKLVNRIRIAALSPVTLISRLRDAYVKMMRVLASRKSLDGLVSVGYHKLDP